MSPGYNEIVFHFASLPKTAWLLKHKYKGCTNLVLQTPLKLQNLKRVISIMCSRVFGKDFSLILTINLYIFLQMQLQF